MSTSIPADASRPTVHPRMWLAVWTLARRELTRFMRQRSRLIGAFATPVMFWVLFGAGLHDSFQPPAWASASMSYREYFLPGIAALMLMFTAIFSAMSIIEDRHEGFLQGVLVAPVSRSSLVLGKVIGGTVLAVVQALLFILLGQLLSVTGIAPELRSGMTPEGMAGLFLFMSLVAFGLTSFGFMLAWRLDSIQGFHAIMNVLLMPMWLMSGAFFPSAGSGAMAWIMWLNPLTYGVAGMRRLLYHGTDVIAAPTGAGLPALTTCAAVMLLFAAVCFAGAVRQAAQPPRSGLRSTTRAGAKR